MADQLTRLQKRLAAIPKRVVEATQPSLQRSANELVDAMKALAPEDTGALKDSIVSTPGGQSTPPYSQPGGETVVPANAVAVTAGNTDVRYAHLVEHGTAEAPAQEFFWPAYRLLKRRLERRTKRDIGKAVRDGWKEGK